MADEILYAPALTVTDQGDGTTFTASLAGGAADGENLILTQAWTGGGWTAGQRAGGGPAAITGNGELVLTLPTGRYWLCVKTSRGEISVMGEPVALVLAAADEPEPAYRVVVVERTAGMSEQRVTLERIGRN